MPTRLRAGMGRKGLSQRAFAAKAGVQVQSVTNWLNGKRISTDRLPAIAEALGMSLDELLGHAPPPPSGPSPQARATPMPESADQLPLAQHDAATRIAQDLAQLGPGLDKLEAELLPDLLRILRNAQSYVQSIESAQPDAGAQVQAGD
jgi:transcriptional regulator with XRE-family HTH domain